VAEIESGGCLNAGDLKPAFLIRFLIELGYSRFRLKPVGPFFKTSPQRQKDLAVQSTCDLTFNDETYIEVGFLTQEK